MQHADGHGFARLALEFLDGVFDGEAFGAFAADFHDHVTRQHTAPVSGSARQRRDDGQPAGLGIDLDLNSDAAELLLDALREIGKVGGRNVRRVGIELGEHSRDRRPHELLAIDLLHVIAVDLLERVHELAEQLEVLIVRKVARLRFSGLSGRRVGLGRFGGSLSGRP